MKLTLNKHEIVKIIAAHLKSNLKLDFGFDKVLLNEEDPNILEGIVFSDENTCTSKAPVVKPKPKVVVPVEDIAPHVEHIKEEDFVEEATPPLFPSFPKKD
jgi:hypothetical protein